MQIRSNLFKRFDLGSAKTRKKVRRKMTATPIYRGLTIEIEAKKGSTPPIIPDMASQEWLVNNLAVSKTSLFRYRKIACLHIPAYEKAALRLWIIKYGEPWIDTQSRRLSDFQSIQSLDKPPFCKLQVIILLSLREMFREMSEAQIVAQLVNNPLYWRSYSSNV